MDVKLDKWHKCKVDIEVLKELSKKSDIKGLQHVSVFFWIVISNRNFGIFNLGYMVVSILVFGLWKHLWFFKSIMA
jgi:hypothetical protein